MELEKTVAAAEFDHDGGFWLLAALRDQQGGSCFFSTQRSEFGNSPRTTMKRRTTSASMAIVV